MNKEYIFVVFIEVTRNSHSEYEYICSQLISNVQEINIIFFMSLMTRSPCMIRYSMSVPNNTCYVHILYMWPELTKEIWLDILACSTIHVGAVKALWLACSATIQWSWPVSSWVQFCTGAESDNSSTDLGSQIQPV